MKREFCGPRVETAERNVETLISLRLELAGPDQRVAKDGATLSRGKLSARQTQRLSCRNEITALLAESKVIPRFIQSLRRTVALVDFDVHWNRPAKWGLLRVAVQVLYWKAKVKVKKVVPVLNEAPRHEDLWGSWSIAPHILTLGTRWRWVVSFVPAGQEAGWAPDTVWTR
jgi:hypothetical protein